jgi:hypothetical protein
VAAKLADEGRRALSPLLIRDRLTGDVSVAYEIFTTQSPIVRSRP